MWTPELIERLHKYVEANRYFKVYCRNDLVYGMDLASPDEPIGHSCVYLEEYDDARPDNFVTPDEVSPDDFHVFLLMPVDWTAQDPDWSAVDPESWAEYKGAE